MADQTAAEAQTAEGVRTVEAQAGIKPAARAMAPRTAPLIDGMSEGMDGHEAMDLLINLSVDLEQELRAYNTFLSQLPAEAHEAIKNGEARMESVEMPRPSKSLLRLMRYREILKWVVVAGAAFAGVACYVDFFAGNFASATLMAFACGANVTTALSFWTR